MSNNGKHIVPELRPPEIGGDNIAYIESDAPIVPCMMPVKWPGPDSSLYRYCWSPQAMSATREIRYFYRRNPRLVEIIMHLQIGFPPSLPTAQYIGVSLVDARTTTALGQALFKEPRRFVGHDVFDVRFGAELEFSPGAYDTFVQDLAAIKQRVVGPLREPSEFSRLSMFTGGLTHLAATLKEAHKDLAHQRSMGGVASQA